MMPLTRHLAVLAALLIGWASPSCAQPDVFIQGGVKAVPSGGRPMRSPPSSSKQKADKDGKKKSDKDEDSKKEKGDKKDGEEGQEDDEPSGPVKRPNEPPKPPDPRELEAEPKNGMVTFSFNGQPWADVLQWLANVCDLSLDWRELPGDYLNLTTQRAYSLVEARDLINRHLQARGYTLLVSGEVMSVFKLDELDPSLIPRVTEEALYDRPPHDIVKLSLALPDGMSTKEGIADIKQALSKHAKAMPLAATKRVLLIDSVANLRMVSALLNAEQAAREDEAGPREFVLTYVQAPEVIDIIYVVLGLDPNSRPSQMELQMQQQKLQLMSELAGRGKDVMKLLQKDGPPVYLAYNRQRNSVLANAPPEQMRIIERTIKSLDVPVGGPDAATAATPEATPRELRQYRLKTIAPSAVISTLEEIGNLSPRAELRGDQDSKTLFARASERDHGKIAELIKQLDGAETVVEVFWLRRLSAEAVAGSIQSLIIEKPKKKDNNDDYPFFFSYRRNNNKKEEPDTLLRVDADIDNNRLIVRGTPVQLEEVRDLLKKLGEPIDAAPDDRRIRTLEALDPKQTARLLRELKEAWPSVGGETELILPPEPIEADQPKSEEDEPPAADQSETEAKTAAKTGRVSPFRLLANQERDGLSTGPAKEAVAKPPISIRLDEAGRLVLSSDDTAALNRLEELLAELAPEPDRYRVFQVNERNPEALVSSLETYFKDFLDEDNEQVLDWWGRVRGVKTKEDEPVRLSRRRPLRFLADNWSGTILVANASPSQLVEIDRLIKAWDRQPTSDRIVERQTTTVKLRFAKASTVVSAIKEIYRDLLSRGDSEFDTEEEKARGTSLRYVTSIRYQDANGQRQTTEPAGIAFDGLLSLGADDDANVVIVSAQKQIAESVLAIIAEMDQQAKPTTTIQVRSFEGGASSEVRRALLRALSDASEGSRGDRSDDRRDRDRRRRDRDRDRRR